MFRLKKIIKKELNDYNVSHGHDSNNPFRLIENKEFFCLSISDDVVIYSAVMILSKFHHLLAIINESIRVGIANKVAKEKQN
ncbi:CLUMA_CG001648, isoform A [Clunio marinus]|uniref:CLUMA_CG001648, isoform A n=1 Tax=Clunio marinus TaxID=568069 RepID=A0A1J1HIM3_9DIPT|nr:CLUMA_CG001648, isoform A [Clunio marinus]